MDEQLRGFVTYKEKKYPFLYENKRLNLFPEEYEPLTLSAIAVWTACERGKTIENVELRGTSVNNKDVIFNVSELCSDTEGFLSFEVNSILEYNRAYRRKIIDNPVPSLDAREEFRRYETCESKFRGMRFVGGDVNFFFPASNVFSINYYPEGDVSNNFSIRRIAEKELGCITWRGVQLNFSAYYRITQSFTSTPLICKSIVAVTFSEAIDTDFLKNIYRAVLQTFRYLMRRNNITFEPVELFDIAPDGLRRPIGELNMLMEPVKAEDAKEANKHGLTIDYIDDKFANLVAQFLDGLIYIDHLPNSLAATRSYKPDRMLFDFVAFEREYANLYPESEARSEQFNIAKEKTLVSIDALIEKNTGRIKKYLKSLRKSIEHTENSLADRWQKVITDCKSILEPFLKYELGEQILKDACAAAEESEDPLGFLVESLNTLRNDMAHGNLDIHVDGVHVIGFDLLETTLYAMRLKALGIDDSTIQHGLARVMKINIDLPEKKTDNNEEQEAGMHRHNTVACV